MDLSDFDFELPADRIAERPAAPRDSARLLVVDRTRRVRTDTVFHQLASFLRSGDTLVINDTKVINARCHGTLERTGREVEVFFERPVEGNRWEVMLHPARRIRTHDRILIRVGASDARLEVGETTPHGLRVVKLDSARLSVRELLDEVGHVPLPPYIQRKDEERDRTDYQTIYADREGAVAAPTAGLHFTTEVLDSLARAGVHMERITLHVGVGTFQPVRTADIRKHQLKSERYTVTEETAERINRAKADRRRIIAVGTTTTRTLEHQFAQYGACRAEEAETDLFIYPGFRFRALDGLLTNFHLPRSTLLMLVCAFAGRDVVSDVYRHAVEERYRFYSFGDATLYL